MAKGQGKTGLIITIVALALTLGVVGTIVILQNVNRPAVTNDTSTSSTTKQGSTTEAATTDTTKTDTTASSVDPATLTSIDIDPLKITVSYTKGTPGFDFAVKRAADRTQYVEFSATSLVGTKCTDDGGVFATIIKNPTASSEQAAETKQKVGSDTYALSLPSTDCTSNVDLLKTYQTAFSNGFSQLKAME